MHTGLTGGERCAESTQGQREDGLSTRGRPRAPPAIITPQVNNSRQTQAQIGKKALDHIYTRSCHGKLPWKHRKQLLCIDFESSPSSS